MKCPFCPPDKQPIDPWKESQCVLNKPLWMVIPAEGIHLHCPVHPEGHHIQGSQITCATPMPGSQIVEYQHDPSKDLTYDSTRPYGTATGFTGNDSFKFSM
jgi:hypothetical protein